MQRVDEGLGKVPAELVFAGVEFLGIQLRWAAGGTGPFVPAGGVDGAALLVQGQGDEESAEGEGSFGLGQRPVVVPEPVGVPVDGQLVQVGVQGRGGAGVVGGDGAAQRREQQRRVQVRVGGRALPPAGGVGGVSRRCRRRSGRPG